MVAAKPEGNVIFPGGLHGLFGIRPPIAQQGPMPMRPPIQQFPQPQQPMPQPVGPRVFQPGTSPGTQPTGPNIVQATTPDPWRRMLGSFDKIKKSTRVKRSGMYKLKAGETVSPGPGNKTSLASLKHR